MKRQLLKWSLGAALLFGSAIASAQGMWAGRLAQRANERHNELIQELGLTASQQAVLASVEAARRQFFMQLLVDLPPLIARIKADLHNPDADLRATAAAVQATVDRELAAHRQVVAARLDLYEALSPQQQAQVRAELINKLEAFEKLKEALLALAATR